METVLDDDQELEDLLDEEDLGEEEEDPGAVDLDPDTAEFVHELVIKLVHFVEVFCDVRLYPYQKDIAYRIIESVIIGDGEEITVIATRQSGKSEVLANVLAGLMVVLPKLAFVYPDSALLSKFRKGFWVGVFGPVEDQGATIWGRIVARLTTEMATEMLMDSEIDDKVGRTKGEKAQGVTLKNSGSLCRLQSCNPKAKIESKSYHFVVVDEAQDADEYTITKSVWPMLAHYNGTRVLTGTAARTKGYFYKQIQYNKRRQLASPRARRNHFEYDWKLAAKYNPNYAKFIAKEKLRIGEDSEEFQMSYCNRWMLERGMLLTESAFDEMLDPSMTVQENWYRTPVVVGIDPARTHDSTVVTVVWVDWDHPDPFGFYEHRILNWLEINNEEWEQQYFQIVMFLRNYNVFRVAVDAQGVGGAVAERLRLLLPQCEVLALDSGGKAQNERWTHLIALMQRRMLVAPGHSKARRLRRWKRWQQQMLDAEKKYKGPYMTVEAPDEKDAHDDYVDSLALACSVTKDDIMPQVQVESNPFYKR